MDLAKLGCSLPEGGSTRHGYVMKAIGEMSDLEEEVDLWKVIYTSE